MLTNNSSQNLTKNSNKSKQNCYFYVNIKRRIQYANKIQLLTLILKTLDINLNKKYIHSRAIKSKKCQLIQKCHFFVNQIYKDDKKSIIKLYKFIQNNLQLPELRYKHSQNDKIYTFL